MPFGRSLRGRSRMRGIAVIGTMRVMTDMILKELRESREVIGLSRQ